MLGGDINKVFYHAVRETCPCKKISPSLRFFPSTYHRLPGEHVAQRCHFHKVSRRALLGPAEKNHATNFVSHNFAILSFCLFPTLVICCGLVTVFIFHDQPVSNLKVLSSCNFFSILSFFRMSVRAVLVRHFKGGQLYHNTLKSITQKKNYNRHVENTKETLTAYKITF